MIIQDVRFIVYAFLCLKNQSGYSLQAFFLHIQQLTLNINWFLYAKNKITCKSDILK